MNAETASDARITAGAMIIRSAVTVETSTTLSVSAAVGLYGTMKLNISTTVTLPTARSVSDVTEPELIQYLKERKLYINDPVESEEDL